MSADELPCAGPGGVVALVQVVVSEDAPFARATTSTHEAAGESTVSRLTVVDGVEGLRGAARARIVDRPESELDEIRAWRSVFAEMGLRPTKYRCAAESLLRHPRLHGTLPTVNPLVDLCNAAPSVPTLFHAQAAGIL